MIPETKNLKFKILAVLLALVISFLLGEILVRAIRTKRSNSAGPTALMLFDNTLIKPRPFAKYTHMMENINPVLFNNWGFHDRNRDPDNDHYRILFLGDSFVEAAQVPVDSLFTSLLEERFRQKGKPVEIINAGFGGTGTGYQYLLWKNFFYNKIRIDHIVVCLFAGNDLEDHKEPFFKD